MAAAAPLVVGITGASGAPYAARLLEVLLEAGRDVHLSISPSGQAVIATELGRTIGELTARGDLRGSSFAFTVEQKGQSWAPGEDGVPRRSIREVSGLFDVSVVVHPAYSSSSAAVARRSMEAWMAEQEETPVQAEPVDNG